MISSPANIHNFHIINIYPEFALHPRIEPSVVIRTVVARWEFIIFCRDEREIVLLDFGGVGGEKAVTVGIDDSVKHVIAAETEGPDFVFMLPVRVLTARIIAVLDHCGQKFVAGCVTPYCSAAQPEGCLAEILFKAEFAVVIITAETICRRCVPELVTYLEVIFEGLCNILPEVIIIILINALFHNKLHSLESLGAHQVLSAGHYRLELFPVCDIEVLVETRFDCI